MKILSISHLYLVPPKAPSGYGGKAIHEPTIALGAMGCEVRVIAPVPFTPFPVKYLSNKWNVYSQIPAFEIVDNVKVYHPRYISVPRSLLNSYSGYLMYFSLRRIVRKIYELFPFDLIHAHNAFPDGHAGLKLSRDFGKPFVVTVRGTDIDITSKRNDRCFRLMRSVVSGAERVIVPSDRINHAVYNCFGIASNTICNGIDLNEICFDTKDVKNIVNTHDACTILMSASQLLQTKGIDLNIRAIKELKAKNINLTYLIVGDGPDRKRLEGLVQELNLRETVKFMGALPHNEVMKFMSACDIFTMPSWQETFGLVYLEAMAHGKPVVGCKGQGMDKIITESNAGLLAEPKDVHSLVNALEFLISNPLDAQAMGERGRKLVFESYSHTKNAEKTIKVYEEVLDAH